MTEGWEEAYYGQFSGGATSEGTRPLVVDSFAGGGSIPLEALRVGAGLNEVQQAVEDTWTDLRGLKSVANE